MVSPWRDLIVPPTSLRLGPTLMSGMSFRWRHRHGEGSYDNKADSHGYIESVSSLRDGSYIGVLRGTIFEAKEDGSTVWYRVHNANGEEPEDSEAALRAHLSLERGVDAASWAALPGTPVQFRKAAVALPGVRCLSILTHVEALVTFVGSANNNIKRNMQMVAALCAEFPSNCLGSDAYGEARVVSCICRLHALVQLGLLGQVHYRFPSVAQLASLTEERLWQLGWGYRAPRMAKLTAQLVERGSVRTVDRWPLRHELFCILGGQGAWIDGYP
jgi:3-methyladenine DNA glycosylase/8-oxoguanine DNA glycosylase